MNQPGKTFSENMSDSVVLTDNPSLSDVEANKSRSFQNGSEAIEGHVPPNNQASSTNTNCARSTENKDRLPPNDIELNDIASYIAQIDGLQPRASLASIDGLPVVADQTSGPVGGTAGGK